MCVLRFFLAGIPLNKGRKASTGTTTGVGWAQPVCPSEYALVALQTMSLVRDGCLRFQISLGPLQHFFLNFSHSFHFLAFKFRRVVRGGSQLLSDLFFWKDFYD